MGVLALMVLVTERWPVELEFRRSSHSFSLTDIPLTLALIFATGTHAFFAVMGGTFVAMAMRRLPPVKFAFNLAQFALVTCVLIVRRAPGARPLDPGFGWITWGAVLAASQLGGVLTIVQIARRDRADRGPRLARARCARCSAWTWSSRSPARRWRSSAASSGSSGPRRRRCC